MALVSPELKVWKDEVSFKAGEPPIASYGLDWLVPADVNEPVTLQHYYVSDDAVVPDGAYVLVTNLRFSDRATLYCASTTTHHRLAPWHLDPGGAARGDTLLFDGADWVPHALPEQLPPHAETHAAGGSDPISPESIGAAAVDQNGLLGAWQMPAGPAIDDLLATRPWGWGLEDAGNTPPRLAYANGATRWYGEPLRPSKTPLLQIIDSLDKLPTEVCAAILDTIPPKLILRGSDGKVYDAVGNLLE